MTLGTARVGRRTSGGLNPVIVDFHTHVLPDEFRSDRARVLAADRTFAALFSGSRARTASESDLLASMDASGVDVSVMLGYGWTDEGVARLANDYLLEAARTNPSRFVPFCSVNPAWGRAAVDEIERCAAAGAKGIGELHPDTQGFDIADAAVMAPVMEAAEALGMVVLSHASEPVGHDYPGKGTVTPARLLHFVESFPESRIVLAHWGGGLPFYSLMPEVEKALSNVWFDSAASPFLYRPRVFAEAGRLAGRHRVLFGSDYPLLPQRRILEQARSAGLAADEEEALLGGNAADLLGL